MAPATSPASPPPPPDQQHQPASTSTSPPTTSSSPTITTSKPAPQPAPAPITTTTTKNGLLSPPLPLHSATGLPLTREPTPAEKVRAFLAVRPAGESGRRGIHPLIFLRNVFRSASWASRVVNVLWPVVPAAIAVRYALGDNHLVIFVLSYLAMVPCANLIGFAGQEMGRKLPHVLGVILETT